jgi:hypothetical protein
MTDDMRKDCVVRTDRVEAVCAAFKKREGRDPEEVRAELAITHPDYTTKEWELGLKEATSRGLFSDERDKQFKTPQGVDTRMKPA